MEFNVKNYKLITDKCGGLDCEDCCFIGNECPEWALDECNMFQVWEMCALAENTPTSQEQLATPDVSKCDSIEREASVCDACGCKKTLIQVKCAECGNTIQTLSQTDC